MIRALLSFRSWCVGLVVAVSAGVWATQAAAAEGKNAERGTANRTADLEIDDARGVESTPKETIPPQTDKADAAGQLEILALGEGSERFWVAFDDMRISIWANRMPADKLLWELKAYGGPTFTCFEKLTRPVTLSLVRGSMKDVLRKVLDAYNFAYYYENGRLAHVRILSYIPGRHYKVADPVVTRIDWTADVLGTSSP
jgi:hypothetical protein